MKLSVGTDIMHINRIKNACQEFDDPFILGTFTAEERVQAEIYPDPLIFYASRFSAKEAVCKALDLLNIDFSEIEIISLKSGRPSVILHGATRDHAHDVAGISLSLSYDNEYVVAYATVIKEETS